MAPEDFAVLGLMLCCALGGGSGERALATKIEDVTVFPSTALVRRAAVAPPDGGRLLIAGLPWSLDTSTLRVRSTAGVVLGLESRERRLVDAPSERVEALRVRLRELIRERAKLDDERDITAKAERYLVGLLAVEEEQRLNALRAGQFDAEAARRHLDQLTQQIGQRRKLQRELGARIEETDAARRDVELALGATTTDGGVAVRDVVVELAAGEVEGRLELEYVVHGASWTPLYDLRAASDARSVQMSYRAEVRQETGEDWSDVSLALSTARPQIGAQGPDPSAVWLSLREPSRGDAVTSRAKAARAELEAPAETAAFDSASEATVEHLGLSVRFRIARRENVPSRPDASNVLIGSAKFDVTPEYFASPALDTNVWLRGKSVNSSAWTMLPGQAAVYFGADFIGHAAIETVQPGQDFVLHLGPDPALTLERTLIEDLRSGSGAFSNDASHTRSWRVRIKNSGAAAPRADGHALVYVREALPRATDDRIGVKLRDPKPPLSTDERWKKDREELGILTWELPVPRGGEATLNFTTVITFPEGMVVTQ